MNQTNLLKYTSLFFFCLVLFINYLSPTLKPEVKSVNTEISPKPISQPTENQSNNPNFTIAKVKNVVDGDTFTLESGQVVRMIGIDTPETVHPNKPVQCFGKEASNKTKELLEGKEVRLEKDVSETDKYKRLLRYVYVGDVLINEYLVTLGFARSSSYPPDIKYQSKFVESERIARELNKGLWDSSLCPATKSSTVPFTTSTPSKPSPTLTSIKSTEENFNSQTCDCNKTCTNMSCEEAQYQLDICGCSARDVDGDGSACDSLCQ